MSVTVGKGSKEWDAEAGQGRAAAQCAQPRMRGGTQTMQRGCEQCRKKATGRVAEHRGQGALKG